MHHGRRRQRWDGWEAGKGEVEKWGEEVEKIEKIEIFGIFWSEPRTHFLIFRILIIFFEFWILKYFFILLTESGENSRMTGNRMFWFIFKCEINSNYSDGHVEIFKIAPNSKTEGETCSLKALKTSEIVWKHLKNVWLHILQDVGLSWVHMFTFLCAIVCTSQQLDAKTCDLQPHKNPIKSKYKRLSLIGTTWQPEDDVMLKIRTSEKRRGSRSIGRIFGSFSVILTESVVGSTEDDREMISMEPRPPRFDWKWAKASFLSPSTMLI